MTVQSDARIRYLEGINNFRDFGDYATAAGRRIKPGVLFRSAHHALATDADLDHLHGLGITTVVDLRRQAERTREPSRRHQAWAGTVLENQDQDTAEAPHVAVLMAADLSVASVQRFLVRYYTHAPFNEHHLDVFRRYFAVLADAPGPVLLHCAAGKDRTGIICALTHHVLGAHDDDIMADYLLTNVASRMDERLPTARQYMAEMKGSIPPEDVVRSFMGVEAQYLDTAFAKIRERHGSIDRYLEDALGVTPAMQDRIRDHLLA
ncbi:tyrosine-protein phosphatase [Zavarzinia sp. CC-PAN008]|uniref:tyrosine-protein phosphatase n=1 Tax=Zavarzinia sp. CC-PAN008 TaxID=3243332 RepID=UPI003F746E6B